MAGFQFFRAEVFSQVAGQAKPTRGGGRRSERKLSARAAIQEAVRAEGCTPHVEQPIKPTLLFGIDSDNLLSWCDGLYEQAALQKVETKTGLKKQRTDVPILMAAVASFPARPESTETSEKEKRQWDTLFAEWEKGCVEFLKEKYGDRLISVLKHTDEAHPHIHAFVADQGRPIKPFHEGYRAADEAKKEGEGREVQGVAYKAGCSDLQDQFFNKVGMRSGLARFGPRKPRKTRAEWLADQRAAEHLARAQRHIERQKKEADHEREMARGHLIDAAKSSEANKAEAARIQRIVDAMDATKKAALKKELDKRPEVPKENAVENAAALAQRVGSLLGGLPSSTKLSKPKR